MTEPHEKACSEPPERRETGYDRGPTSPPKRRRDAHIVKVVLPDEPPELTPAAARAMLRLLLHQAEAGNHDHPTPQGES